MLPATPVCLVISLALLMSGGIVGEPNNEAATRADTPVVAMSANRVSELAGPYLPISPDRLNEYRKRAVADVDAVNRLQDSSGTARRVMTRDLPLDQLVEALSSNHSDSARLRELLHQCYGRDDGLADPAVLRMRQSLTQYRQALLILHSTDLSHEYERRIESIASMLNCSDDQIDVVTLGAQVAWLEFAGQAPELVSTLRQYCDRPNAVIQVSRDLALSRLSGLSHEYEHKEGVNTTILGARVTGPSHTQTQITPRLTARQDRIDIELEITGTVRAPANVAVRSPAVIYSRSTTQLDATKTVFWDGKKLDSEPAKVSARTSTVITGADSLARQGNRRGLIGNMALRRAERNRTEAESQGSRVAERRVAERINQQVSEQLVVANQLIDESLHRPLARVGMLPSITTAATDSLLLMELTKPAPGELAAATSPPWDELPGDVGLAIHESALTAMLCPRTGGARWTDKQFADIQRQALGDTSLELRIGAHPRWSVVLDDWRPMSARITDSSVQLSLEVRQLQIESRTFECHFRVEAEYELAPTTTTLELRRTGPVRLHWFSGSRLDETDETYVRDFVSQTLSGFFLDVAYLDGLHWPAGGAWGGMSTLRNTHVDVGPGWLRLVFQIEAAVAP